MRQVIGLAALLMALGAAKSAPAQMAYVNMSGAGSDIRRTVIADGVYQFTTMRDSYVRQLNSIVIVNRDDVLVFDTGTRPSSARIVIAEIRKITNKPVRYIVNSHGHPDHWSGNEAYQKAFPGLEIIATKTTDEFMHQRAAGWAPAFTAELERRRAALALEVRLGKRADGTVPTPQELRQEKADLVDYGTFVDETRTLRRVFPTMKYEGKLTFLHGGREFRFLEVTGDQEGTTVLYLPAEKILLTGDAVSYPIPFVSKPAQQARDLRMLSQLDTQVTVPGHGPAFHDKAFLLLEISLFDEVAKEVADARKRGVATLEGLQAAVSAETLRRQFTGGDPDLEARFRTRLDAIVELGIQEAAQR